MATQNKATTPSLRQVLALMHMRIVLFAVLMAGVTLIITGVLVIRGYSSSNLALIARTVAYTVEPALVFDDMEAAKHGIAAVATSQSVHRVEIEDDSGRMLLVWQRPGDSFVTQIESKIGELVMPAPALAAIRKIGPVAARVRIYGGADGLGRFILSGLATAIACLILTSLASLRLARRLQRDVTEPLAHIMEVAHSVRAHRQFDRRVPTSNILEVNALGHDFNALLDELHDWHRGIMSQNRMLERQATSDALTSLGNRAMFEQVLPATVTVAKAQQQSFALLYIDLNHFKQVNDTHGHEAGDTMLIVVAARLRAALRSGDQAFRLGGDEFALLLMPNVTRAEMLSIERRIMDSMTSPVQLSSGIHVDASLSIGCAHYPENGEDARDLVRFADAAMYSVKTGHHAATQNYQR